MAFPFLSPQGNLSGYGVAVGPGIACIEKLHGPEIDLPAFEDQLIQSSRLKSFLSIAARASWIKE